MINDKGKALKLSVIFIYEHEYDESGEYLWNNKNLKRSALPLSSSVATERTPLKRLYSCQSTNGISANLPYKQACR